MTRSIRREIERLEKLGERVVVGKTTITLYNELVSTEIIQAFAQRMRKADSAHRYSIVIRTICGL